MFLYIFLILNVKLHKTDVVNISKSITFIENTDNQNLNIPYEKRIIQSPIFFGLPTKFGFSRELHNHSERVDLTFERNQEKEEYLECGFEKKLIQKNLNNISSNQSLDRSFITSPYYHISSNKKMGTRYEISKNLINRIKGAVIFPLELNKKYNEPWSIKAELHIDEDGFVSHVLLENSFYDDVSELTILKMLYNLRFKSGSSETGWIKLFSQNFL